MTKDELFKLIDLKVDGLRNRAIIKDAVEDYSSASNNGKPIVSGALLQKLEQMIIGIEAQSGRFPKMFTDDVLRLLKRLKELGSNDR